MSYPKQPFDVLIDIADIECIASIRIIGYVRGAKPTWNPVGGGDLGWPAEVEWELRGVRVPGDDDEESERDFCKRMSHLLAGSNIIRDACLEAIDDHNQPPEI